MLKYIFGLDGMQKYVIRGGCHQVFDVVVHLNLHGGGGGGVLNNEAGVASSYWSM